MTTKYKLTAISCISGNVICSKVMNKKPTWSDTNRYAEKVAVKHGSHPRITVTEI